ncbi:MAG TPA: DUF4019 domain-containing protein [Malonomonas sp.]
MKTVLLGICCLFLAVVPCLANDIDNRAIAAARSFTEIVDEGNFQAAYWFAAPLLRLANAEQLWTESTARSQRVLGKVLDRKLKRIKAVSSPPGLPDDDYRIILFDALTEYKAAAAEVILLHQVAGLWQVCSYSIR